MAAGPCEVLQVRQRYSRMADRSVWSSHTTVPGPREEKESVSEEDVLFVLSQPPTGPQSVSDFCLTCFCFFVPTFTLRTALWFDRNHYLQEVLTPRKLAQFVSQFRCLFHINGCTHGCGPQFVFLASVKKVF